jgi:hypothetical protein
MASDDRVALDESDWPITNPWPLLVFGLGCAVVALVLFLVVYWRLRPEVKRVTAAQTELQKAEADKAADKDVAEARTALEQVQAEYRAEYQAKSWPLLRVLFLGLALLAGGGAVSIRPRSPGVVAVAGCVGFLCFWAIGPGPWKIGPDEWDSARMVVGVLTAVAAVAALLLLLPGTVARVVVSLLIVFHFSSAISTCLCIQPPGGSIPWIPRRVWNEVFRPYAEFTYLNNAYHFYSPEPGPACLLWCRIEYEDESSRWVKIPNREEHFTDPLGQEYYRRLSLTESVNQAQRIVPSPTWDWFRNNRVKAGGSRIPLHPYMAELEQYNLPQLLGMKLLPIYARRIINNHPHDTQPELQPRSVKIYRVTHLMMQPYECAQGLDPNHKKFFVPVYLGEYDREGNLKDRNDPLLYWVIPIIPIYEHEKNMQQGAFAMPVMPSDLDLTQLKVVDVKDCLTEHAGSSPWGGAK